MKLSRHQKALRTVVTEADNWRRAVEERRIAAKQDVEEINVWSTEVDGRFGEADSEVRRLGEGLKKHEREHEMREREEQIKHEALPHETNMKFQTELYAAKTGNTVISVTESAMGIQAKLPKLVITKFDGTYMDWPRFWGQLEETINKTSIPNVTKFTCLRELLNNKVKKTVEALPSSVKGYNGAKTILKSTYGKESEVVKAYTKEILRLPQIFLTLTPREYTNLAKNSSTAFGHFRP